MPMPVEMLEFNARESNTLRGFAKIRLGRAMLIYDVAIHEMGDRRWAQAPSKPQLTREGTHKMDGGKKLYSPIIAWESREASDDFSESVLAAYDRFIAG